MNILFHRIKSNFSYTKAIQIKELNIMKRFHVRVLLFLLMLLHFSCNNNTSVESGYTGNVNVVSVNYDPNVSVNDLYALEPNVEKKIGGDPECIEFFDSYWNDWVEFENDMSERIGLFSDLNNSQEKLEELKSSDDITELAPETRKAYKTTVNAFKSIAGSVWNGISLLKLEKKRNILYESFSEEKKGYALAVEIVVNSIIYDAYHFPLNTEVKEAQAGKNYRCVNEQIQSDEKANEFIKDLTRDFSKLQKDYRAIRAKICINKLTRDSTDYSSLVELGKEIIKNKGEAEFDVKPDELNTFFVDFANVSKMINYKDGTFVPPVDDWSEKKQANFKMILDDIHQKMQDMVVNLNENPVRSTWSPWDK